MAQQTIDESVWNQPKEASMGCHNTGIHQVGLRAEPRDVGGILQEILTGIFNGIRFGPAVG